MFSNSILNTVLKALPRDQIQKYVALHQSDRWRKSFKTWDHLVAMLMAQFSGVNSLRELEVLFSGHGAHHYHLGVKELKRSTLSDANRTRDHVVFRDIAQMLIARSSRKKPEMEEVLTLLDSSPISLTSYGYDWADLTQTRHYSRGVKLHVHMDYTSEMIDYAEVSTATVNDISAALTVPLKSGRIYVFDKGYCDYNWWHKIHQTGSHFVTRLKRNAAHKIIKENDIAIEDQGFILQDHIIELTNKQPRAGKTNQLAGHPLRLLQIKHPGGKARPFLIVSNDLSASAQKIAGWYKRRWSIELLFKWVKQNLKLKRFIGRSRNAVLIQIYVALIAYILLKTYKKMIDHAKEFRLKDILVTIKTGLFTRPEMTRRRQKYRKNTFQNQQELWSFNQ